MIFVILGTQKFQMNRLLIMIDGLVADGKINSPVIAQTGQSDYEPRSFEYHNFMDKEMFDRHISESELVITHAGASSIITALKYRKPVVVCPRLAKYGEHVDDHQREIARAFAKKGYVVCCDDGDDLEEKIILCKGSEFPEYVSRTNEISRLINDYLANIDRSGG